MLSAKVWIAHVFAVKKRPNNATHQPYYAQKEEKKSRLKWNRLEEDKTKKAKRVRIDVKRQARQQQQQQRHKN